MDLANASSHSGYNSVPDQIGPGTEREESETLLSRPNADFHSTKPSMLPKPAELPKLTETLHSTIDPQFLTREETPLHIPSDFSFEIPDTKYDDIKIDELMYVVLASYAVSVDAVL
jgi:hypothetical protein